MGNLRRVQSETGHQPPPHAQFQDVLQALVGHPPIPDLDITVSAHPDPRADGALQVSCRGHRQVYVYAYKESSTPQAIEGAIQQAKRYTRGLEMRPLIIVPYLSESRLNDLASREVSGLDLCGNGVLIGSAFYLWRSGNANRFSESRPIKNVYRGNSSIFTRCLVLQRSFPSLTALRDFARQRLNTAGDADAEAGLTLGTASKVVSTLEEQLLVARDARALRVLDTAELMSTLQAEYRRPDGRRLLGNAVNPAALFQGEAHGRGIRPLRRVVTGLASACYYGVLSAPDTLSVYVSDLDAAAAAVGLQETKVFPKLELIEERAQVVYFDGRQDAERLWASPLQTWLELTRAGPREREAAESLAQILRTGQESETTHERG